MLCQLFLLMSCMFPLSTSAVTPATTTTVKPLTNKPPSLRTTRKPTNSSMPPINSNSNGTSSNRTAKQPDLTDVIFKLQKESRMLVNDVMSLKQRIAAAVAFFDDRLKVTTSSLDKKIISKSNYLNTTLSRHGSRIGSVESDVKELKLVIAEYVQKILHYHGLN